jgi:hypothetical protein
MAPAERALISNKLKTNFLAIKKLLSFKPEKSCGPPQIAPYFRSERFAYADAVGKFQKQRPRSGIARNRSAQMLNPLPLIPTDHTDLHERNYPKPSKVASDELEFWSFSIWIFGNFGISGNTLISVHQLARFFIR